MTVKIIIEGDGLNYLSETTLHKAAQIIAFMGAEQSSFQSSGVGVVSQGALIASPQSIVQTNITPRQSINQAGAKTNVQKIVVIAKYLKDRGQEVFVKSEIVEEFRRAGEISPKNMGRDFKEAVVAGFICETPEQRGEFYLTNEGEMAISARFVVEKEGKRNKVKSKKPKNTTSSHEPTNESLKNLEFIAVVDDMPDYWDIKKGDKICWILAEAKTKGIDLLTNKDIEYVARELGDNINSSSIDALSKVNRKFGYLHKSGVNYRILKLGIDHLNKLLVEKQNENGKAK